MDANALDKAKLLQDRTKKFAIRIIKLYKALPKSVEAQVIGKQILRAGTAVAANYRAACRSRSKAEFSSRPGIVVEEADESLFWMELLTEADIVTVAKMKDIMAEANELRAIFAASRRTLRDGK